MKRSLQIAVGASLAAVMLAGCATSPATPSAETTPTPESAPASPRVAVGYEGGVLVLDGQSLDVVADFETEEFIRLNSAGDGRHAVVTTSAGFQLLDVQEPALTDLVVPAAAAGHVVRHAGKTVLYDDATSDTTVFETADLADLDGALPDAEVIPGVEAHHGVSVILEDGTFLTTVGTEAGRTGIRVVDADGHETAVNDQCPAVHGEGTAEGEAVVFGCENGALVYLDGEITKLTSPDEYGRIGNAYVSEESPLVVMDYKDDPDAEGYLLHNIALVDTEAMTLEKVALPDGVEYTFRGIARGSNGDALLIGADGSLHQIDPATGDITASHPVIDPWESPAEWQQPHPAIVVLGDVAYVTDPATNSILAIDAATGEVLTTAELPETPNEMTAIG